MRRRRKRRKDTEWSKYMIYSKENLMKPKLIYKEYKLITFKENFPLILAFSKMLEGSTAAVIGLLSVDFTVRTSANSPRSIRKVSGISFAIL